MKKQTLRIIAGSLRGRKLYFPEVEGLRPTPDRVRETLFNWLQEAVVGARCLDLFAGSGALGFEALSRGAKEVVMLDTSQPVVKQLKKTAEAFCLKKVDIVHANFLNISLSQSFDIVFIDPPFNKGLAEVAIEFLLDKALLNTAALIYVEVEKSTDIVLPKSLTILKEKTAGDVRFLLLTLSA